MVILKRVATPTYPHPLWLTHKKCPPTPTQPKYTFTYLNHPHPPIKIVQALPPTQKITPPPHLSLPTHKNCPLTSTHPKYTSTHPNHPQLPIKMSTHPYPPKIYLHATPPFHKMYPCNSIHPKYTVLINVLKCSRTDFNSSSCL